jgi:hypothetical protein
VGSVHGPRLCGDGVLVGGGRREENDGKKRG